MADAQVSLLFDWDWARAERGFLRGLQINPAYVQAHAWYNLFYQGFICGRWDEAIAGMRGAQRNEPLSAYMSACVAFSIGYGRRAPEAIEWGRAACKLDPTSFIGCWALQTTLFFAGQYPESIEIGDKVITMSGRSVWAHVYLAAASARVGDLVAARSIAGELEARGAREYVSPYILALVAGFAGDRDRSSLLFREALSRRDPSIPVFSRWVLAEPEFERLPACADIIAALKFPGWKPGAPGWPG